MKSWVKNLKNAPLQYQQGWTEFYKLRFELTRDVLIPRPESELLVDAVLNLVNRESLIVNRKNKKSIIDNRSTITVLDLGTGSGAIAIAIAKNNKDIKIIATDISKDALKVAEENSKLHKVEKQIIFIEADLISNFKNSPDIIVTNLPYIPTARLKYIDPMVTEFEPRVALDGGEDGFALYRTLFSQMKEKGIIPKYLFGEIDYTHGELAIQEALKYFPNCTPKVYKDLTHMQRILSIKFRS